MSHSNHQRHRMYARHSTRVLSTLFVLAMSVVSRPAQAAPDLDILASAGLGDDLGGTPVAIDLSGEGVVLISERGGQGTLLRLDAHGQRSDAVLTIPGGVDDLAVDRGSGNIVVAGSTGLIVYDPGFAPLWQRPLPGGASRVALGEHGTIAALSGAAVHTFSADGRALGRAEPAQHTIRDLAVFEDAGVVVTTGWSPRSACEHSLDVASLAAFALDGAPRWHAYGDTTDAQLCGHHGDPASTRGVAVTRGEDGLLYLLAEVEGRDDIFRARPGQPEADANNIVFDVYTDPETARPARHAYFARFTADGVHLLGQYFLMPAAGSQVHARQISADTNGNVYLAGAVSHSLGAADDVALTEPLDRLAGFYQVVEPDFEARRVWSLFDADDMHTDITALAMSGERVVTLLAAAVVEGASEGASLPAGPGILMWPGDFGPVAVEKRPDPETQGTFGYESGISGSDPTCYCDTRAPAPAATLALVVFTLAGLRRPRRRA